MSESVSQEIASKKPLLLQKIESNPDLANVLMALLGRVILECTSKGFKLNGVIIGDIQEINGGEFRAHVTYNENTMYVPEHIRIAYKSDFLAYLGSKNSAMAKALHVNTSIARYFEAITHRLEQFASHKSIPFPDLKVLTNGAFISKDNVIVIKVGKEDIGVTQSRGLKKFFGIN